jgi:hypothetical protein
MLMDSVIKQIVTDIYSINRGVVNDGKYCDEVCQTLVDSDLCVCKTENRWSTNTGDEWYLWLTPAGISLAKQSWASWRSTF